jgi:hypothetical protein
MQSTGGSFLASAKAESVGDVRHAVRGLNHCRVRIFTGLVFQNQDGLPVVPVFRDPDWGTALICRSLPQPLMRSVTRNNLRVYI